MKKITYFYLKNCPYCKMADKIIKELIDENPEFSDIEINRIEESQNPELANSYDYYYVPCFWIEKEKFHEGVPTKRKIRSVFMAALKG